MKNESKPTLRLPFHLLVPFLPLRVSDNQPNALRDQVQKLNVRRRVFRSRPRSPR